MKKKWIIGAAALLTVGCAAVVYSKASASKSGNDGLKTVEVKLGTLVEKALATGEIAPRQEIDVKSKISGIVARIFKEEGDRVSVGDPLIEVKPTPTPLEYAQKKRTLEMRVLSEAQRTSDFERIKKLYNRGMASRADFENASQACQQAVLNRKMAEEELAILDKGKAIVAGLSVESVITSPVSGHVLKRHVDVGDPVVPLTSYQPGTELLTIANMDDLLMKGTAEEIDVGKICEGMPVEIKVGAFPDKKVTGVLSRISLQSRKQENATVFDVEISSLTASEDTRLRAGYSANANVIIQRAEDVPILPERVVEFRNDSTFVKLPAANAEAPEERQVVLGMSDGINAEILSGLQIGDKVLEKKTREIK